MVSDGGTAEARWHDARKAWGRATAAYLVACRQGPQFAYSYIAIEKGRRKGQLPAPHRLPPPPAHQRRSTRDHAWRNVRAAVIAFRAATEALQQQVDEPLLLDLVAELDDDLQRLSIVDPPQPAPAPELLRLVRQVARRPGRGRSEQKAVPRPVGVLPTEITFAEALAAGVSKSSLYRRTETAVARGRSGARRLGNHTWVFDRMKLVADLRRTLAKGLDE